MTRAQPLPSALLLFLGNRIGPDRFSLAFMAGRQFASRPR